MYSKTVSQLVTYGMLKDDGRFAAADNDDDDDVPR